MSNTNQSKEEGSSSGRAAPELTDEQIDAIAEEFFPPINAFHGEWLQQVARPLVRAGIAAAAQALPIEVLYAIRQAHEFAIHAPHGDNCYLTDDYPGNDCSCGKESLENALHEVSCKFDPQYGQDALSSQSEAR